MAKSKKKKDEVRLKKIPIDMFLQVLTEIYERGVDYFDIIGIPDEEQDTISIIYSADYMSKDAEAEMTKAIEDFIDNLEDEEPQQEIKKDIKLSDDDLNQLT
jgi:hypothetical protein